MSDGAQFGKIEGLDELLKSFDNLKDLDVLQALTAGGYVLMKGSMEKSPVDTGFLRNSHELVNNGKDQVTMNVNAEYSYYQEFGVPSRNIPAVAFVRRTIDEDSENIVQAIGNELNKQIESKGGSR
jgi:HK97 gp10 family phage protein